MEEAKKDQFEWKFQTYVLYKYKDFGEKIEVNFLSLNKYFQANRRRITLNCSNNNNKC